MNNNMNSMPMNNVPMNNMYYNKPNYYQNSDRLIGGGFAFPFLLGGVTGAAIAPAFWNRPQYRPYYGPNPYYYGPYYR